MATKVTDVQPSIPKLEKLTDPQLKAIDKLGRKLHEQADIDLWQSVVSAEHEYKTCAIRFEDLTRWVNADQGKLEDLKSRVEEIQAALKSSVKKTGFEERARALEERVTVIKPGPIDPGRLYSLDWFISISAMDPQPPELWPLITVLSNNDIKLQQLEAIYKAYSDVLRTETKEENSLRHAIIKQEEVNRLIDVAAPPGAAKKARVNE
ncbi:MAG: hypothetical protein ABSA17_03700 [Rhabdochlamydiaceae bacterium]